MERERCAGSGEQNDTDTAIIFGVGRCPECGALAPVDDETGRMEDHDVVVVTMGRWSNDA